MQRFALGFASVVRDIPKSSDPPNPEALRITPPLMSEMVLVWDIQAPCKSSKVNILNSIFDGVLAMLNINPKDFLN